MSTIDQYVANATQAVENWTHVEGKDCGGWHSEGLRQRCYKGYHVGVTNVNCPFFLSNQFLPWLFRRTKFWSLRKMFGAKDVSDLTVPLLVKSTVLPYDATTVSMVTVLLCHATPLQVRKLSVRSDRALVMSWAMMILVGRLWTEVQTSLRPRPDIRTYAKRFARVGKPL